MTQKITTTAIAAAILSLPLLSAAQVGIPCNGPDCTFDSLIQLVNNIIKFLMFGVAVPLAAIGFMFVGAKMVLSSNKESAKTEAKESFGNIVKGFLIMLGAYVVVKTIVYSFITDEQKTFMGFLFQ
ncbi:MAG: hypothetical protein M0P64_02230 [Candidatus Pacebacteria bacterium]|jgi:hypothetical protein|nr:hypothetical protein [Candidatus Paceibacterota bacterium]